jgi:two-component system sensor histidine kinase GlrK
VYYPRSFLKFILLGFLLVSLPLIYALAELILSLDRLASQAGEEVLQAAQAGRTSRLMFEQTATLERIARQHLILEDNALLDDYAPVRQEFRQAAQQLAALPLEPSQQATLTDLTEREGRLYRRLTAPQRTSEIGVEIVDGYAQLVDGARAMTTAANQLTQRAIERLQVTATQGREKWFYVGLATVGIAIALAILFATLIARRSPSLIMLDREVGPPTHAHDSVSGPQDLRYGQVWVAARVLRSWSSSRHGSCATSRTSSDAAHRRARSPGCCATTSRAACRKSSRTSSASCATTRSS